MHSALDSMRMAGWKRVSRYENTLIRSSRRSSGTIQVATNISPSTATRLFIMYCQFVSKALAGIGGFCVSNHAALRLLHFAARPYVFTASGSPASIASVETALRILLADTALRDRLWANVRHVRAGLTALGFRVGATESPIVPIEVGDAERAIAIWTSLLEAGVYTNIVLPPACRADACLLRTSYSAAHTPAQIDQALGVFERVGRECALIGAAA